DVLDRVVATISVGSDPDAVAYDPTTAWVLVAVGGTASLALIDDATDRVVHRIPVGVTPDGVAVDPTSGASFVANFGSNNVTVIGNTTQGVAANVPVGDAPDGIVFDPSTGEVFVSNARSGNVSVFNATSYRPLTSFPVGTGPDGESFDGTTGSIDIADYGQGTVSIVTFVPSYPVTFIESGLANDTSWSVTLPGSGSTSSSSRNVSFLEPNGSYRYFVDNLSEYSSAPSNGTLAVSGTPAILPVEFVSLVPVTYSVTIHESGLPTGTPWWVRVDGGSALVTTGVSLLANEPNGSFPFTTGTPDPLVIPPSGNITVHGAAVEVPVTFDPFTFPVRFTEHGLPPTTNWSVTFAGELSQGTGDRQFPGEINGTYPFTIGSIPGYSIDPIRGSIPINGSAVVESITFQRSPPTPPPQGTGELPGPATIFGVPVVEAAAGLGILALLAGAVLLTLHRRRSRAPPKEGEAPPELSA
ncbi:MAG: YncE family protein, partial [Thermoplasmata archaeon]|nr:YncE family protein [Thermoplasmata archaeon]